MDLTGKGADCYRSVVKQLEEASKYRDKELAQACSVYGSIEACTTKQTEARQSVGYTQKQLTSIPSGVGKPLAATLQYLDKQGADYKISDGLAAVNYLKQLDALASSPEFIKAYQSDTKVRSDFKKQVESLASIVQQSGRAKEGFMFDKEVPLTNIGKLGGINTGEVGVVPVYPEFELIGLGLGKVTKTATLKLLSKKSIPVGGKEFINSQTVRSTQRGMSVVDGEMAGGNKLPKLISSEGIANAATYPNLKSQLIGQEIAGGHAFIKHVQKQGEFKGLNISSRQSFEKHIENVINNYSDIRSLSNGRTAYWHSQTNTVVIRNPKASDGGTAFQPKSGKKFFDNLK